MLSDEKLRGFVNSSGFPLQLYLEHLVEESRPNTGWRVLTSEHAWANPDTSHDGFIDLVLEHKNQELLLVVESKRVRDTNWIFLNGKEKSTPRCQFKAWGTHYISGSKGYLGWHDCELNPTTEQAQFCIVPGQDQKSKPMLESTAVKLIEATEIFAIQDKKYHDQNKIENFTRIFLPVIVTTADLKAGYFDINKVDLANGEVGEINFAAVPYIRFRKQLSNRAYKNRDSYVKYRKIDSERESSVMVVNSNSFVDFLKAIEINP